MRFRHVPGDGLEVETHCCQVLQYPVVHISGEALALTRYGSLCKVASQSELLELKGDTSRYDIGQALQLQRLAGRFEDEHRAFMMRTRKRSGDDPSVLQRRRQLG